jgi:CBS domain containing-hemolysin-like protein
MEIFLTIIILSLLIFINAIYVASEFATVSAQKSRFAILAEENQVAKSLLDIIENSEKLDKYIATAQVGITITSFVLGFVGQDRFIIILTPLLENLGINPTYAGSISTTIILILLTITQVLFGELIPKNIGIIIPEKLAIATYYPIRFSSIFLRPLISFLNGSSKFILRIFGLNPTMENNHDYTASEISIIAQNSSEAGLLAMQETQLLTAALESNYGHAKEIMVPRIKIEAITIQTPPKLALSKLLKSTKSRFLVYEKTLDKILGTIHVKDLIRLDLMDQLPKTLNSLLRPVIFIPESTNIREIMQQLQIGTHQVAVVVDEYGGTSGMITVEDLVEEIFGDIADEFDTIKPEPCSDENQNIFLIQGQTRIKDVEKLIKQEIPVEHAETIAGFLLEQIGRIPETGEHFIFDSFYIDILQMDGNSIDTVEIGLNQNTNADIEITMEDTNE